MGGEWQEKKNPALLTELSSVSRYFCGESNPKFLPYDQNMILHLNPMHMYFDLSSINLLHSLCA